MNAYVATAVEYRDRKQRYADRKRSGGFVQVSAWIPADKRNEFAAFVARLSQAKCDPPTLEQRLAAVAVAIEGVKATLANRKGDPR